jgi:hypothetical protein
MFDPNDFPADFGGLRHWPCLDGNPGDSIDLSGNGADAIRIDDNTIVLLMPNGGTVRLTSAAPIYAEIEPNGR